MGEEYESKPVIGTSPAFSSEKLIVISSSSSSSSSEEEGTPLRPILCLTRNMDLKAFDDSEDCYILDFDPFDSLDLSKLSVSKVEESDDDLAVVAEKGQVACRDYPHSRHLCVKFPFESSAHESCCDLCFCYVCDSVAPCEFWTHPQSGHCHATEDNDWKLQRQSRKSLRTIVKENLTDGMGQTIHPGFASSLQ